MRRTFLVWLFLSSVLSAQTLQGFSGTWRIDPKQVEEKASVVENPPADAPPIPPPPPPNHRYTPEQIRRAGNVLKISGGEAGTTAIYTIDPNGEQVSDPIPDAPGSVRIASTHWSDGKLVTRWKMERNGVTFMHGTDTRSLTADGRQILERVIESPRHKAAVRLVLERVK
jgi:hypothetical protein